MICCFKFYSLLDLAMEMINLQPFDGVNNYYDPGSAATRNNAYSACSNDAGNSCAAGNYAGNNDAYGIAA